MEEVVRVVCCPHGCEKGSYSGPCATLPGESRRVEIATALMPLFARAEAAGRAAGLEEAAKKVEENAGYWADAAAASDDFTPSERRIARAAEARHAENIALVVFGDIDGFARRQGDGVAPARALPFDRHAQKKFRG